MYRGGPINFGEKRMAWRTTLDHYAWRVWLGPIVFGCPASDGGTAHDSFAFILDPSVCPAGPGSGALPITLTKSSNGLTSPLGAVLLLLRASSTLATWQYTCPATSEILKRSAPAIGRAYLPFF